MKLNKAIWAPLSVFLAFVPAILFWGLSTQVLTKAWGTWVVFITSPLLIASYECFYRVRIELRKERGETKL